MKLEKSNVSRGVTMRTHFKDLRAGGNRRWTGYKRLPKSGFLEIYELLEGCQELKETELIELSLLIEIKLNEFQQFYKDKAAISKKGEDQREAVGPSQPSTTISKSAKKYQNIFWRWYDKLASIAEKDLNPDCKHKDCQNPYNKILY